VGVYTHRKRDGGERGGGEGRKRQHLTLTIKRLFSGDASINGLSLALITAGAIALIAITSANSPVDTCNPYTQDGQREGAVAEGPKGRRGRRRCVRARHRSEATAVRC